MESFHIDENQIKRSSGLVLRRELQALTEKLPLGSWNQMILSSQLGRKVIFGSMATSSQRVWFSKEWKDRRKGMFQELWCHKSDTFNSLLMYKENSLEKVWQKRCPWLTPIRLHGEGVTFYIFCLWLCREVAKGSRSATSVLVPCALHLEFESIKGQLQNKYPCLLFLVTIKIFPYVI